MEPVFDRVKRIIIKQLGVREEQVTGEAAFLDDLGADSIDSIELVMAFETEFNRDILEDDLARFKKVEDVVSYIEDLVGSDSRG